MIHDSVQGNIVRCSSRFVITLCLAGAAGAAAHDIPNDATVQAFVKPADHSLQLLVRVPLKAIRDLDFPEQPGGALDIERLVPILPGAAALWIAQAMEIHEGDELLRDPRIAAVQVSLESDRSFASFDLALAHVTGPKLPNSTGVVWNQALFDVLLEYPIRSPRSPFSIRPGFDRLASRVLTVLRFLAPGGAVRAYEFTGDPGLLPLDPRWHQAALRFVEIGFRHILDGTDHLLFLFCLVIPLRRLRPLILVVTAFTLAHSCTLIASAYDLAPGALWFPPLIETLIAVSIVYMALENIAVAAPALRPPQYRPEYRWMIAFGFGLIHGFGFSFALRETLQFAGSHLLASLLAFNIGVELGQLLVLLVLIPALSALFRYVMAERIGTIILSALVAHTGWHWMLDRWDRLRQFHFEWPVLTFTLLAGAMRWALAILLLAGLLGLFSRLLAPAAAPQRSEPENTL